MADTTPDVSNKDQMFIVVRYVTDNVPVERLLSLTVLAWYERYEHGIDVEKLHFQSYDFTACMSGQYNGCHKKLNEKIQKGSFFSSSTKRSEALAKAQENIEGALKLLNLSQTRWIARSESIDSVWISYESIVPLLQKIVDKELKSDTNTQDQGQGTFEEN